MRKSNKSSGRKWMPGTFGVLKTSKHKQFRFHTRYYDQEKEEFEQRVEQSKRNIVFEKHAHLKKSISFQKEDGTDDWLRRRDRKDVRNSNIRLWIILFLISAICIYMYKYLDEIFK